MINIHELTREDWDTDDDDKISDLINLTVNKALNMADYDAHAELNEQWAIWNDPLTDALQETELITPEIWQDIDWDDICELESSADEQNDPFNMLYEYVYDYAYPIAKTYWQREIERQQEHENLLYTAYWLSQGNSLI